MCVSKKNQTKKQPQKTSLLFIFYLMGIMKFILHQLLFDGSALFKKPLLYLGLR